MIKKPKTGGLTMKTMNWSDWTDFGLVPLITKLHRFLLLLLLFFPLAISLIHSVSTLPLSLSLSHSLLISLSLSHHRSRSPSHCHRSWSHHHLDLFHCHALKSSAISIFPLCLRRSLNSSPVLDLSHLAMARPRSLLLAHPPTQPKAMAPDWALSLSFTLTVIWLWFGLLVSPYFLCDLVYWFVGLNCIKFLFLFIFICCSSWFKFLLKFICICCGSWLKFICICCATYWFVSCWSLIEILICKLLVTDL